ncbi:MAG TPA: dCTP deaminase, partial [Pyrinomonadaceae bacterium]|nr:dCTP deaminase [Pyrinomonadaceae bacterium]
SSQSGLRLSYAERAVADGEGEHGAALPCPPLQEPLGGLRALARTVEYFRIPRNVLTICLGKSTYARCGIIVNVTPFEPEWEGHVTLEFSNTTPLPAKIYANEGVAQVIFFEAGPDDVCETSYKDRGGKYQKQQGVTLPKL